MTSEPRDRPVRLDLQVLRALRDRRVFRVMLGRLDRSGLRDLSGLQGRQVRPEPSALPDLRDRKARPA